MFASAFDQDAGKIQSLLATANELRTNSSDNAVNRTNEDDRSQTSGILADSYLIKVLSGKDGTNTTSLKKRPLVCIPCKIRFNRRSKLDQHNRYVHNADIRYSCDECAKTFSRPDHIARHVKNGHCRKKSQQSTIDTELAMDNDETPLLEELSIVHLYINVAAMFNEYTENQKTCYSSRGWHGSLVVGRRTCDPGVAGSRPGRNAAAQQP